MFDDFKIPTRPLTADDVLAILVESHHHQVNYDPEAEPNVKLTFESTIAEWRDACDLVVWWQLGCGMNGWFKINASDEQWRDVLEPAKESTLRGVCELIVEQGAVGRMLAPVSVFGAECLPAGAFLTIRSLLREHGADVTNLSPSSELAEYARRQPEAFLQLAHIAPNRLPAVRISTPAYNFCALMLIGSSILACIDMCLGPGIWALIGGLGILFSHAGAWVFSHFPPRRVWFGDLRTFRDLCRVVAAR